MERSRKRTLGAILGVAVGVMVVIAGVVTIRRAGLRSPPVPRPAAEPPRPTMPVLDAGREAAGDPELARVETFVRLWAASQVQGGFDKYAAFYAPNFTTRLVSRIGRWQTLNRDQWLSQNRTRFKLPLQFGVEEIHPAAQAFESGGREVTVLCSENRGVLELRESKVMRIEPAGASYLIVAERPELDDRERPSRTSDAPPTARADEDACEARLEPGATRWLAIMPGEREYADALHFASRLRRARRDVEIIDGRDFAALGRGYWVVVGAANDKTALRRLPAEAIVISGELNGDVIRTNLRWRSEFSMDERECVSLPITVDESFAYALCQPSEPAYPPGGKGVSEPVLWRYRLAGEAEVPDAGSWGREVIDLSLLDGASPVRLARSKQRAYVLDNRGRWFALSSGQVEPSAEKIAPEDEGTVALAGTWTYRIADSLLSAEYKGKPKFEIPLVAPAMRNTPQVFAIGNRLVLRGDKVYLFDILNVLQPARLTKLCSRDAGLRDGAEFDLGDSRLTTARNGELDLWTSLRGMFYVNVNGFEECEEGERSWVTANDVAIFDGHKNLVEIRAECHLLGSM